MSVSERVHVVVREMVPYVPKIFAAKINPKWLEELAAIEARVMKSTHKKQNCANANSPCPGFNLGNSIEQGWKVVHCPSTFARKHPDLYRRTICVFEKMINHHLGKQPWFKRLYQEIESMVKQIHGEDAIKKIFPMKGIPLTAIWFSTEPISVGVHNDSDAFGFGLSLTTKKNPNFALSLLDDDSLEVTDRPSMKKGEVMTGSWLTYFHRVDKVRDVPDLGRPSITLYCDKRIFLRDAHIKDHRKDVA